MRGPRVPEGTRNVGGAIGAIFTYTAAITVAGLVGAALALVIETADATPTVNPKGLAVPLLPGTPVLVCNDGSAPHIVQPGEHLLSICRVKGVPKGDCVERTYRADGVPIDPDILHAGDPMCFDI